MVALVSVVTAGSCHIAAVGVVHHSRTRGAQSCIPVSECRSVPSVHLRCLTLEQLSGLTPGLRQHGGRCPASMAWSSRSAWLRGFGEFVIGRQRPNHGCALSFAAARPWRLECFLLNFHPPITAGATTQLRCCSLGGRACPHWNLSTHDPIDPFNVLV